MFYTYILESVHFADKTSSSEFAIRKPYRRICNPTLYWSGLQILR